MTFLFLSSRKIYSDRKQNRLSNHSTSTHALEPSLFLLVLDTLSANFGLERRSSSTLITFLCSGGITATAKCEGCVRALSAIQYSIYDRQQSDRNVLYGPQQRIIQNFLQNSVFYALFSFKCIKHTD